MSTSDEPLPDHRLARAAAILAAVASLLLLILPTSSSMTTSAATGGGPPSVSYGSGTLLTDEGYRAVIIVALPALVALMPLLFRTRVAALVARIVATLLLAVFVVLEALSVGPYYLPAAILMAFAAARLRKQPAPKTLAGA